MASKQFAISENSRARRAHSHTYTRAHLPRARRSGREKVGVKFRRIPTAAAAVDFASVFAYTPHPHPHMPGAGCSGGERAGAKYRRIPTAASAVGYWRLAHDG